MIGFLRKVNWGAALVWGLLFVATNSSFAFAAEQLSPEKIYLNDVYKNMMDVNSLHYDIMIKAETPMGEVQTAINGDVQEKPLIFKHDINFSYRDILNNEKTVLLEQYIEENQDNLEMYLLSNKTWTKQIVPIGSPLNKNLSADEKVAARMKMLQFMKSVTLKKETPSYKYMEITLDMIQISDAIGADAQLNNKQEKDMLTAIAFARLGLLAAGDIKYIVKIDKANKMVKEIEMDLTEPIRKGAKLVLDIGNPKNKAAIEDFLTKSTLHMQVTYSNYNQVDSIEIPQDVRDNAKEVKLTGKEASKKSE